VGRFKRGDGDGGESVRSPSDRHMRPTAWPLDMLPVMMLLGMSVRPAIWLHCRHALAGPRLSVASGCFDIEQMLRKSAQMSLQVAGRENK
jgi:hypothetical protein